MLFQTEEELRRYLPNSIPVAEGELGYLERLRPALEAAEARTISDFIGQDVFDLVCADADAHKSLYTSIRDVVAFRAVLASIPWLDSVLTPNGFGVVNSTAIGAASQHRVAAIVAELKKELGIAQNMLLRHLRKFTPWLESEQALPFAQTLSPEYSCAIGLDNFSLSGPEGRGYRARPLTEYDDPIDRYREVQLEIARVEHRLAAKWLSFALLDELRLEWLRGQYDNLDADDERMLNRRLAVKHIRYAADWMLWRGELIDSPIVRDHINMVISLMRNHPDHFVAWTASPQFKALNAPAFENRKDSSGFFF